MFGRNKGGGGFGRGDGLTHGKGYGLRPDAPSILREVAREMPVFSFEEIDQPELFELSLKRTKIRLYAIPILNGDSYRQLNEFFEYRTIDLDEASGVQLQFLDVGDPRNSGSIFMGFMSPEERAQDERLSREVGELLSGELIHHHRLRQMKVLADYLKVDAGDLPCFAFMRPGADRVLRIFPLSTEWWIEPGACTGFGRALKKWLSELNLSGAAPVGVEGDRLKATLDAALERLTDEINDSVAGGGAPAGSFAFEREGVTWRIIFESKRSSVAHSVGMTYLQFLLRNPHQNFHAQRVRSEASGVPHPNRAVGTGPRGRSGRRSKERKLLKTGYQEDGRMEGIELLDKEARRLLKAQLKKNEELIRVAAADGQIGRKQKLEEENVEITKHLAASEGLSGRSRRSGDQWERDRKSVSNALTRALAAIRAVHPEFGEHLAQSVDLGTYVSYRPTRLIRWRL